MAWDRHLVLRSDEAALRWRLGGLIQLDGTWAEVSSGISQELGDDIAADRVGFRSARLFLDGFPHEWLRLRLQADLAGAEVAWRDAFLEARASGLWGHWTVGQFREPLGMDQLTSVADVTFLERNLTDVLVPGRSLGVAWSAQVPEHRLRWSLGTFHTETSDLGEQAVGDGRYALTGRIAWAPHHVVELQELVHLGLSASSRSVRGFELAVQRPEFVAGTQAAPWATSGELSDARSVHLLGAELAGTYGPLSYQGEYLWSRVERSEAASANPWGWYAQLAYALTGETRPYRAGVLERPVPDSEWWDFGAGTGAWEVALRYSSLDLDAPGRGEELASWTSGLNWYANSNLTVRLNYVFLRGASLDGRVNALGLRLQWHF